MRNRSRCVRSHKQSRAPIEFGSSLRDSLANDLLCRLHISYQVYAFPRPDNARRKIIGRRRQVLRLDLGMLLAQLIFAWVPACGERIPDGSARVLGRPGGVSYDVEDPGLLGLVAASCGEAQLHRFDPER